MFTPPRLDSPPPLPHHRPRPWSPDQNDPFSTLRQADDLYRTSIPLGTQRRETSDVSVEALDLADYARTLRARQTDGPYPAFPSRSLDHFPPSSYVPATRDSRDTLSPPSLISRGPTLSSSNATSRSSQRPFSMPSRDRLSQPRIADTQSRILSSSSEIDVSKFPAWSRSWYQAANGVHPRLASPPIDDLYTAIPSSNLFDPYKEKKKKKKSVFDPGYIHYEQEYDPLTDPSSTSDPTFAPPHSSITHESTRDLLPWSHHAHGDASPVVDPLTKEERMRMLEREFGKDSSSARRGRGRGRGLGDFVDEDGRPLIGTVDTKGYLVTQGPKKRTATRMLQILFALGAGIPAIYAAIAIKPDPPPPPANKPPAFILYVISILTFLLLFYLFFVRPCCCSPRRKNKKGAMDNPLSGGMMVLPIPNRAGGKKKNKRKKKEKGGGGDGDVQVNLIVDPHVFSGRNDNDNSSDDDEDDSDTDSSMPGGYYGTKQSIPGGGKKRRKNRRKRRRRRSVFAGLAMEEEWRRARGWARKMAFVDGVGIVVWGAVFIYVMIGRRCPVGKFDGWCNAYNVSTACACLLCIAFGVSVFFDVKDLYASRTSPRTRI